ncbi:MAG: carboxypeptidase-like regulatory domain-containing protein [Prevotella sp.]|nr:carboxypeptidase-like regulatory domain-containing protein [Prevotella sp.]
MKKGKAKCKALKDIRRQIAVDNGIKYVPHECHHKGDCAGTCPACDAEIRYLESALMAHKRKGFGTTVAGLAAGVCALMVPGTAVAQTSKTTDSLSVPVDTVLTDSIPVVDLAGNATETIEVRGIVRDDRQEPLIGCIVKLAGTKRVCHTDINGLFAVKVPLDALVEFNFIGYESQKVSVSKIKSPRHIVVTLKDAAALSGEVVVVGAVENTPPDDVYYRPAFRPKSHREKNKR